MEVKYVNLSAQFKDNQEVRQTIDRVLASGQFILGPALEEFERNFARLCGVKYAVGVDSGTDALFLALKVLKIGQGDEVITVPNSFVSSVAVIALTGAFPRLVDVGEDYNISLTELKKAITNRSKAIMPVHLTGTPARMPEIMALAREHNLGVVEDAAQAIDASIDGQMVGSFGDMGVFSLHPLKNLNTCGDGGVITTNSEEYYRQLLLFRNHGLKNRDESVFFAYNCRLDSLKAAVANLQIKGIRQVTEKRNAYARIYDTKLSPLKKYIKIPPRRTGVQEAFHTYVVQVEKRDELAGFLKSRRVETKVHYPIPIHLMEACRGYGYQRGDFPVAERQARMIISLPVHQYLTEEQILYVIDCIYEFYGEGR